METPAELEKRVETSLTPARIPPIYRLIRGRSFGSHSSGTIDLRKFLGPVQDQGPLGSCVSQAFCAALARKKTPVSVLFSYFTARGIAAAEYSQPSWLIEDRGLYIIDVFRAARLYGVCSSSVWPYNVTRFNHLPSPQSFQDAFRNRTVAYGHITNPNKDILLARLHLNRFILFGHHVHENFLTIGSDGIVPKPAGPILGGHAMLIVGYNFTTDRFIIRNSWGTNWGDKGHCYFATSDLLSTCFDFYWL